ncbi:MAG: permease-like cell division protein FtsX [Mogibacterium sp.]|nr:permease-like cell division protein FtsX [Mogibacterium sp.]
MFSRIGYTIRQAFSQLFRNKGMSFTAMLAITAMMLILGIFFVAFINVDLFARVIQEDYNVVEVYMADENDDVKNQRVGAELQAMPGVTGAEFRSKDDALEIMKERWGENAYLLEDLKHNPLPDSWLVYVEDKDAAASVSAAAAEVDGVDDVKYYQDTVEKLAKITDFIRIASIAVMAFLIIVSVIIVSNTIKLTVFNRAKEISIMKYLGATDWFVRAPFILEGILIGAVSAGIATGLMYLIYDRVTDIIGPDVMRVLSVPVVSTAYLIPNLLIIFISLGVGIGTCGSIISIRKFLDR